MAHHVATVVPVGKFSCADSSRSARDVPVTRLSALPKAPTTAIITPIAAPLTAPKAAGRRGTGYDSTQVSRGRRVGNGLTPPQPGTAAHEQYIHRVAQRRKQLCLGKQTDGYRNYIQQVPVEERDPANPRHVLTPRSELHVSKRTWDAMVRTWRRTLHTYDSSSASAANDSITVEQTEVDEEIASDDVTFNSSHGSLWRSGSVSSSEGLSSEGWTHRTDSSDAGHNVTQSSGADVFGDGLMFEPSEDANIMTDASASEFPYTSVPQQLPSPLCGPLNSTGIVDPRRTIIVIRRTGDVPSWSNHGWCPDAANTSMYNQTMDAMDAAQLGPVPVLDSMPPLVPQGDISTTGAQFLSGGVLNAVSDVLPPLVPYNAADPAYWADGPSTSPSATVSTPESTNLDSPPYVPSSTLDASCSWADEDREMDFSEPLPGMARVEKSDQHEIMDLEAAHAAYC